MKKGFAIIGIGFLLVAIAVAVLLSVDFNRFGKETVFYKIETYETINETKLDSGEVMNRYVYTGTAYDEEGTPVEVEFEAAKELREGAFLKLYLKNGNVVTSYDEVQVNEQPSAVQF